jgi:hypothetical protein
MSIEAEKLRSCEGCVVVESFECQAPRPIPPSSHKLSALWTLRIHSFIMATEVAFDTSMVFCVLSYIALMFN